MKGEVFWETLGLLLSDGYIGYRRVTFGQTKKHYKILYLFKHNFKIIEKNIKFSNFLLKGKRKKILGKICTVQDFKSSTIYNTKIMKKWLQYKNDFLSGNFYPKNKKEKIAFIRGYYYGDGTLYTRENKQHEYVLGATASKIVFSDANSLILKRVIQLMYDLGFPFPLVYQYKKENCKNVIYNNCSLEFVTMIKPLLKLDFNKLKLIVGSEKGVNKLLHRKTFIDDCLMKRTNNPKEREDIIYKKPMYSSFSLAEKLCLQGKNT